jgi:hypothetical protein
VGNEISYSIFYNNIVNDILGDAGTGAKIYNNYVEGSIDGHGSSGETARNNYASGFVSIATMSNNIRLDTISLSNEFKDYLLHDYHLKPTSKGLNVGYDWGQTEDYDGTAMNGVPDVGPFEYIYPYTDLTKWVAKTGTTLWYARTGTTNWYVQRGTVTEPIEGYTMDQTTWTMDNTMITMDKK